MFRKGVGKKKELPFVSCVVVAGGSSSRMGGVNKLGLPLGGDTVIGTGLKTLQSSQWITELVLVIKEGTEKPVLEAASCCDKVSRIVHGGSTRAESSLNGVKACSQEAEYILIHDGARPLVTLQVIENVVKAAIESGAAVPGVPVTDTIKVESEGFAVDTPERSHLYAAQTPQGFRAELIRAALQDAVEKNAPITDDCSAVERLGMKVRIAEGDLRNRKLTYPWELSELERLWKERRQ